MLAKILKWTDHRFYSSSSFSYETSTNCLQKLGDNESGKTTLVARLQGVEEPRKGSGLEYYYIDVKDDYRDGKWRVFIRHKLGLISNSIFHRNVTSLELSNCVSWMKWNSNKTCECTDFHLKKCINFESVICIWA